MRKPAKQTYRNIPIVSFPSGMGGWLPGAVALDDPESSSLVVICLDEQFFTNWVLSVPRSQVKANQHELSEAAKRIIDSRKMGSRDQLEQDYYFTFGSGSVNSHKYVRVVARSWGEARDAMFEMYGKFWAFQYDRKDFMPQIEKYGYSELLTLIPSQCKSDVKEVVA